MFSKSNVPRFNDRAAVSSPIRRNSATNIIIRGRHASKNYGDIYQEKSVTSHHGSLLDVDNSASPRRPKSMDSDRAIKKMQSRIPLKREKDKQMGQKDSVAQRDVESLETGTVKNVKSNETCPTITTGSNTSVASKRKAPSAIPTPIRHTFLTSARLHTVKQPVVTKKRAQPTYRALEFHKRDIQFQYNMKKRKFSTLKDEFMKQQKQVTLLYSDLLTMRNRIKESEGKEIPLEELRIVEYLDTKQRLPTGDANILELEEVKAVKRKLENSPAMLVDLCRQIVEEKQDIIDRVFNKDGDWNQDEFIAKIQLYKMETAAMVDTVQAKLKAEQEKMTSLLNEWHSVTRLQPEMNEEIRQELEIKLQETEHRLKQTLTDLQFEKSRKLKENDKVRELEKEVTKQRDKILDLTKNVEDEKAKLMNQRERQAAIEQKLKVAKGKIRDSEVQKEEAESRLDKMNNAMKRTEEQWRSKEIFFENRQKEMQKQLKIHESTIAKYEKERTSVDARFDNIKGKHQDKENSYKDRINQLEASLKQSEETVAELQREKETAAVNYNYLKAQLEKLDVCHHSIFELCKKRTAIEEDVEYPSAAKTDEEVALWTELEETKIALRIAEDKLQIYKKEKERFMENIKINYHENKDIEANPLILEKESQITDLIMENDLNKQFQYQLQQDLKQKNMLVKTLQEQVELLKKQENADDSNQLIRDLRSKWETELDKNTELNQKLTTTDYNLRMVQHFLKERESLLGLHDTALNQTREKKNLLLTENESLKHYVQQLKDKIQWLHDQHSIKTRELTRVSNTMQDKSKYIREIESKVVQLEDKFKESLNRRMILQQHIADLENGLRRSQRDLAKCLQREQFHQFISHCKNINISECIKYRGIQHVSCNASKSSITYKSGGNGVVHLPETINSIIVLQEPKYGGTRNDYEEDYT